MADFYAGMNSVERIERSIAENRCGFCGESMTADPYQRKMREAIVEGSLSSPYPVCFRHFAAPETVFETLQSR